MIVLIHENSHVQILQQYVHHYTYVEKDIYLYISVIYAPDEHNLSYRTLRVSPYPDSGSMVSVYISGIQLQ